MGWVWWSGLIGGVMGGGEGGRRGVVIEEGEKGVRGKGGGLREMGMEWVLVELGGGMWDGVVEEWLLEEGWDGGFEME